MERFWELSAEVSERNRARWFATDRRARALVELAALRGERSTAGVAALRRLLECAHLSGARAHSGAARSL